MNNNNEKANELKEKGKFYLLHQQFEKAIEKLKESEKESQIPDPEVYYLLGLASESIRNYEKAREFYEEALKFNPNFSLAKDRLEKIIGK